MQETALRDSLAGSGALTEDGKALLECYNIIENEIALDYYPLKKEETLSCTNGKLVFSRLTVQPAEILSVKDKYGNRIPFRCFPDYLEADCESATVLYSYAPSAKGISDNCEYGGKISARLMAFGVVSEYLIRRGEYERGKLWAVKYRDCLQAAGILRHPLSVRSRRWA